MSSVKSIVFLAIFLFLFGIFGSNACTKKPEDHLLKKETFSKALREMLVIQYLKIDEKQKAALIKDVLKKYHITKKEFEATKAHYAEQPEFWVDVFKNIRRQLDEENSPKHKTVKPKKRK